MRDLTAGICTCSQFGQAIAIDGVELLQRTRRDEREVYDYGFAATGVVVARAIYGDEYDNGHIHRLLSINDLHANRMRIAE